MGWFSKALIGLRWLPFKDGLGASNHFEAGGFIRSEVGLRWPDIQFNYLQSEEDREGFRRCVRLTREIINQPAMDRFRGVELAPGPDVTTDEEIDAFVRANMESTMHPCGSCRMGEDDMAVVDSSVFPTEPNGNLNAPTIMLAERASDLVRGKTLLPEADVSVGLTDQWQTRQRTNKPLRTVDV
jgi:choline dehydrogenase